MRFTLASIALLALVSAHGAAPKSLDIYFIDVEGGQSTLLVTPNRESFLIDTGWAGHANRISAAARDAGIQQIDYLLITHFHSDHDGGAPGLSQLMPIRHFVDHGTLPAEAQRDKGTKEAF